ncbi:SprT family zinc-dependent metalloprotease [Oceanimonas pelagia]|uniref:SprT family zinc-dependent metalloprotease n=1 Tax=Oceanimonas pelagia TaxID=3028314 RepID=A0AA50KQE9_9GAMM|nr:SprT family zinc-dependent metalloprotease [Oceanimonas pelagia]WMC11803.1 SprT family zinc-dependent metalloprotease [Oceanimonas pelagia]
MKPDDSLFQQVQNRVSECLALAERHTGRRFDPPLVCFNQRGRIAGSAWLEQWELRFNPVLLTDNAHDFLSEIVPHEVAHLVVFALYGKVKPHGREWQAIMAEVFGLEPRTRHRLNTEKVAPVFSYDCGCRIHKLSLRRHNKVLRGQLRYQCLHCGQPLIRVKAPHKRKTT